ncbi:tellurite resistance TerB family protein [Azoarcus sp. L1K30]|uniref:tellurite resistance TerB family protein n=1 Tax=Azoarcus sp. L1K30 TaxID=2820277 RepID=UPI001B80EABB|nr:tellurite resistance TerB family protein [Azoarcus sp. L1K30]MBR0565168.1 tellurite resistance TerB family protein [Azoarcus sp. L1K30]
MSFGNIIGQLLQQGMAANSRERLDHALGARGLGGMDGLGELLGSLAGGQGGRQSTARGDTGGLGDLLDLATGALGGGRGGSASSGGGLADLAGVLLGGANGRGAQGGGLGGLGDLAGVLLGGGSSRSRTGNSAGNGAGNGGMAILGTLAIAAFKYWQQSQAAGASSPMPAVAPQQFAELTSARNEALVLRAMISAAKADGEVDDEEISRIVDKIDDDGVSEDEKRFIADALRAPVDLPALAADVPDPLVGAQVYAASLLAINLDTDAERNYLRQLAQLLQLDASAVERLHTLTGAPRI